MNRNRRGDDKKNLNRPEDIEMYVLVSVEENDPTIWTELSKELSKKPEVTMHPLFGNEGNEYNEYSIMIKTGGQPESVGENICNILCAQGVNGKKVKILSHSDASESSKKTVMNMVRSKKGVDEKCVIWSF